MMTFGFLNENISFRICPEEIIQLRLVVKGYGSIGAART